MFRLASQGATQSKTALDEGLQRGSGRPIPPLVSKFQIATTKAGAKAQGGLTPDFLALSIDMDEITLRTRL